MLMIKSALLALIGKLNLTKLVNLEMQKLKSKPFGLDIGKLNEANMLNKHNNLAQFFQMPL
jgi:hypothetical protein